MLATSTTCTNPFLEDDGFCTQCGKNHLTTRKTTTRTTTTSKPSVDEIWSSIKANPIYNEALETVNRMAADYGVTVKVVFRNRQDAYTTQTSKNEYLIVFGYQCLTHYSTHRYTEYAKCQWVISGLGSVTGTNAARLLAIHEFSHIVDIAENQSTEIHGPAYQRIFKTNVDLYF